MKNNFSNEYDDICKWQRENPELHEGNMFFGHRYSTWSLERMLENANSFDEFARRCESDLMDESFLLADFLWHLLDKYGVTPTKASLQIGRSQSYVRKIINGQELNPSRDVLLAICVYLGTTVEEAQILLRYSGKAPLYVRRKRDVIVWYALKKKENLIDLNCYLEENGYSSLSKLIFKAE